jgi:sec-independent protein translocase protein TatA
MGLENPLHIALLLMVLLLVFGAKRLPEMGRGLGDGMRSFKDAISGNAPAQAIAATDAQHDHVTVAPTVAAEPAAAERQTVA